MFVENRAIVEGRRRYKYVTWESVGTEQESARWGSLLAAG
jgi:hypothetical protein